LLTTDELTTPKGRGFVNELSFLTDEPPVGFVNKLRGVEGRELVDKPPTLIRQQARTAVGVTP
jgi:hypothetical protein